MTVYKPRSAWTSSARGGARLTGSKLLGIAWHWPGTSQNVIGFETETQVANRLRGYRNFHVNTRGWSDIGYNMAIDQAGRVWDLRGLGRVGAHAASSSNPDANHEWMGVLLVLGDRERPSVAMIRACQDFMHGVFLPRWPGRTRDTGHGRAPGVPGAQTSCPGPFAAELIVDDVLTERPQPTRPQEDDMPYRDWPKADQDALVKDVLGANLDRDADGPAAMSQWANDQWPDHLATRVAPLIGYTAVFARSAAGHSSANRAMLTSLEAKVAALLDAQGGLDTAAILARIDQRASEDAQRDQAVLDAIGALESGDTDAALAKLRDLLDAALPDA